MKFHLNLLTVFFLTALAFCDTPDFRPKFDKSSFKNTMWTHVNPWFSPGKERKDANGGPNYAFKKYVHQQWGNAFSDAYKYGRLNFSIEFCAGVPAFAANFKKIVKETYSVNPDVRFSLFLTIDFPKASLEDDIKRISSIFNDMKDEMLNHPAFFRIDGAPIVEIYMGGRYDGPGWGKFISGVEKDAFRCIWLLNTCNNPTMDSDAAKCEAWLRNRIPYFDGIMQYGNYTETSQAALYTTMAKVMAEYPHKIMELSCQNVYANHFHFGGIQSRLSRKWRKSVETTLKHSPDAITLTNFFDHWENSLVFPCYEREDFLLRYMQYFAAQWRGEKFQMQTSPELVLTNYVTVMLGRNNLDFEIIGFPIDSGNKKVSLILEICGTDGEVLHAFPARTISLDTLRVEEYSLPSEQFAQHRAVVPRIKYTWNGHEYTTQWNPMTELSPSIRNYWMFWARSTKNALLCNAETKDWSVNGVPQGGTMVWNGDGSVTVKAQVKSTYGGSPRQGWSFITLKRNGMEYYTHTEEQGDMNFVRNFLIPPPGGALTWYHLELENKDGFKYQTLPIWVTDGSRNRIVKIPLQSRNGEIREYEIEDVRVPFFYYPCDRDDGTLFVDRSGYMHNGRLNGSHLRQMNYNFYLNGSEFPKDRKVYVQDEDGSYFLHLTGKDGMLVMGATAFPAAATFEASIRISEIGSRMGIFGTMNNQINVTVEEDGRIRASRTGHATLKDKTVIDCAVLSKKKISIGEWHKIEVVYDTRQLSLYIDGELQDAKSVFPMYGEHSGLTGMTVGSGCSPSWTPVSGLKGDMRQIRIYGRNLSPEEFL